MDILTKQYILEDAFEVEKNDEILFISIQPRFSELIRTGVKTVELRKRMPKKNCKIAIIYESAPIMKATFLVKIKRIEAKPKKVVWEKYSKQCAVSKKHFDEYYTGSKESIAIVLGKIIPLEKGLTRKKLMSLGLIPPQDYRYAQMNKILR